MISTPTRSKTSTTRLGIIVAAFGAALVIAGGFFTVSSSDLQDQKDQSDKSVSDIKAAADPAADSILNLCARQDSVGKTLRDDVTHPCDKAADVKQVPVPQAITNTIEERLSPAEIGQALNKYFVDHPLPPGQLPTMDQVIQGVTTVCAGGKCVGPKGDNATFADIATIVDTYCANDKCRGPQGIPGPTGDAKQAVLDYCAAQPGGTCKGVQGDAVKGDKGNDGTPGPTPKSSRFEQGPNNGGCLYTVVYSDGTVIQADAPDAMCGIQPPATTPTQPSGWPTGIPTG